ncbi:Histidine phosphatase superfamily (branch 1) family protein [Cryptosporidium meleagridis]|uniref:phosphoglycerate mutase (2,3-diphosphoglycerate-dependent) n=1 Tax=Cryptosporidium meleagridis TaxID=93969 RepID=A0A2P4Z383_9CRYT|nr:Histidine phosphatase superfamily (branch 1) family protein [Cryptosporidium meleagridis]
MMYKNMPVDLVLVRHGQSEGNLAQRLARQGELHTWTGEFRRRHNSQYRLTDRGRAQARIAGEYIKNNIGFTFDKCFTSEYVRAMETAAMLGLPNALWNTDIYLRERDRGVLANKTHQERVLLHPDEMVRKQRNAFYWQPSGGESLANLCLRIERVLDNLSQNCGGLRVIIVCHGGVIKSFRALLESERGDVNTKINKINNCQIVWYTRRDPERGSIANSYNWVKSVCPWDLSLSSNTWKHIHRPTFTNEDLLQIIQKVPQLVNAPVLDIMEDSDNLSPIEFSPNHEGNNSSVKKNTTTEANEELSEHNFNASTNDSKQNISNSDYTDEEILDDSDIQEDDDLIDFNPQIFVSKYFKDCNTQDNID